MKESILYQFGQQIRALRIQYKLTQEELAHRSHISLKYIQRIEGKNPPNIGLVISEKLANGFGITITELFQFKIKTETKNKKISKLSSN